MKAPRRTIEQILDTELTRISDSEVESVGERILYRLHHAKPVDVVEEIPEHAIPRQGPRFQWWLTVGAAVACVVLLVVFGSFPRTVAPPSTVEKTKPAASMLPDGSQIEAGFGADWSVETAEDGIRVRLKSGTIIVTAARQQQGRHFYVETRDLSVTVVGTVFVVRAEEQRSAVGLIEGKVHVRRGASEVLLLAGEQLSSGSFLRESLDSAMYSWSRSATRYLAMLRPSILPQENAAPAPASAAKRSFEVASIRPTNASNPFFGATIGMRGDRFVATNMSLFSLIHYAYTRQEERFLRTQFVGLPAWADTDRYDVEATVGQDAVSLPISEVQQMVQVMLEQRFQLKARRTLAELPVYKLALVNRGPKLSADQTPPPLSDKYITFNYVLEKPLPRGAVQQNILPVGTSLKGKAVDMEMIVRLMQGRFDRFVVDDTHFKGLFDIDLQIERDSGGVTPPENPLPTVFAALQDINVKVEPGKATVPAVIVDSVRRPTEN